MSASIYKEKLVVPNNKMLTFDLAATKEYLSVIEEYIENVYGGFSTEWKFYNRKSGWILKMFSQKRNILFIVPCNKHFRAVFTFGNKAVDIIFNSELPDSIKSDLFKAKKYIEGRTIQLEIRKEVDLNLALEMIRIKMLK